MQKERIRQTITSLRVIYNSTDTDALLKALDINVEEVNYLSGSKLAYSYDNKIVIRSKLPDEIRQFVMLHELGHLLLHDEPIYTFRTNTSMLKQEKEANDFALFLLGEYHDLEPEEIRFRLNDAYKLNI